MMMVLVNHNEQLYGELSAALESQIRFSQTHREVIRLKKELMYFATGSGEKPVTIELELMQKEIDRLKLINQKLSEDVSR